jgi:hypothetical protein
MVVFTVLAVVAVVAATRGEYIVTYDQLERTDVPHQRATLLDAKTLEVLCEEDTDLNVGIFPKQRAPGEDDFEATSGGKPKGRARRYRVGTDHPLARLEDGPARSDPGPFTFRVPHHTPITCGLERDDGVLLEWPRDSELGCMPRAHLFGRGRSLFLAGSGASAIVADLAHPALVPVDFVPVGVYAVVAAPDQNSVLGMARVGASSRVEGRWTASQAAFRVFADGGVARSEASAPTDEAREVSLDPSGRWLAAIADNEVSFFDVAGLRLLRRVSAKAGTARGWGRNGENTVLVAGCSVIDVRTWEVTTLDACASGGFVLLVTDEAVYVVGGREHWNKGSTRLHRFDLATRRETAVRDFDGPWTFSHGWDIALRPGYLVSGGRLLVLSGTTAGFLDHAHLF